MAATLEQTQSDLLKLVAQRTTAPPDKFCPTSRVTAHDLTRRGGKV